MSDWQSIESAPRRRTADGKLQRVLLIAPYPTNLSVWSDIREAWWSGDKWERWPHAFPPTHWMPLPPPPRPFNAPDITEESAG